MQWWQAIILGLVQGLTEFLPVSSSGHLTLLQRVFGLDAGDAEVLFDIIMHLGTLIAVCALFWRDILDLFKKPFKTLIYLIVATIPAGVAGLLLDDIISDHIMGGRFAGIFLAVFFTFTAGELLIAERYAKRRKRTLPLCWRTTLSMGFAQAVAIVPGISRSGTTVSAGILAGADSESVSKFSFLMSIPVILGSFLVQILKIATSDGGFSAAFSATGSQFGICIALGFIVAAASGLFAIKVMINAIKKANYKWFSLYLVLLAMTCIILFCFGVL